MCIVSNIGDYGKERFPSPIPPWDKPFIDDIYRPSSANEILVLKERIKILEQELAKWKAFKELMDVADKVDILFDQKECVDPAKYEWYQDVLKRLSILEAELNRIKQAFNGPG